MSNHELILLGAPILEESKDAVLLSKLEDLKLMVSRLKDIDAHDSLVLLRHCFAIPKLTYFIRCTPYFNSKEILQQYDEQLRLGLQSILNVELNEDAWLQSSLPIDKGGLGIRLATDLALPAFLSSCHGAKGGAEALLPQRMLGTSWPLLEEAGNLWKECVNNNALQPSNPSLQAAWDTPLTEVKHQNLLNAETRPIEKARLLAVSSQNSSDWLKALPIPSLGLKLDNSSLRIACGLRLGSALCQPHTCKCGKEVDSTGRHGLCCKKAEGRHSRHSQVNDLIKRALASAQIPSIREPPGLSRDDGKRPDGLTLLPWSEGRSLIWDYPCSDTLAPSHISATSEEAGKSAEQAERKKITHYEQLASSGYIVMPVATETLGSWGQSSLKFIKQIGSRITDTTGEPRSTSYLLQAISMAIQRGNAASIIATVNNLKSLDEIFYL